MHKVGGVTVLFLFAGSGLAAPAPAESALSTRCDFAQIGTVEAGIYSDSNLVSTYMWDKDGIRPSINGDMAQHRLSSALPSKSSMESGISGHQYEVTSKTTPATTYIADDPIVVSPDGKYYLAGLYKDGYPNYHLHRSSLLGVIDTRTHELLGVVTVSQGIDHVIWSPDSVNFATSELKDVGSFRAFKDFIIALFGWRNHYYDVFISLYRIDGTHLCTQQVAKNLAQASVEIKWTN